MSVPSAVRGFARCGSVAMQCGHQPPEQRPWPSLESVWVGREGGLGGGPLSETKGWVELYASLLAQGMVL